MLLRKLSKAAQISLSPDTRMFEDQGEAPPQAKIVGGNEKPNRKEKAQKKVERTKPDESKVKGKGIVEVLMPAEKKKAKYQ